MPIKRNWVGIFATEDEYGEPETWEFHFKRPSSRAMLAFVQAGSDGSTDESKVVHIMEAVKGIILKVKLNGSDSSIEDMPFEMFQEVLGLHPTFRSTESPGA